MIWFIAKERFVRETRTKYVNAITSIVLKLFHDQYKNEFQISFRLN